MELLLLYKGFTPIGDFFNYFVLRDYDMNARQLEVYHKVWMLYSGYFLRLCILVMKNQQKLKLQKILESTDAVYIMKNKHSNQTLYWLWRTEKRMKDGVHIWYNVLG